MFPGFSNLTNNTLSDNLMANCHASFLKFNTSIALNPVRKKQLQTSRKAVRDRITAFFKAKQNGLFPKFHGQGSYIMNTIILPKDGEFDIDDGIYFLVDKQPTYSVETFHNWIVKAVDGHTQKKPIDKQTCVRLVYAGQYHLDLPIYYIIQGQCPRLAHKDKGWIESDPREFIKWFNNKADEKGQLKRIVRYLKSWSDYRAGELPSGLIFSILAANNISFNEREDIAFHQTLVNIKNSLNINFACYRPTTPFYEDLLANCSKTNKDYFLTQLSAFIESAEKALNEKTSLEDADKVWKKHFGERFLGVESKNHADSLLEEPFSAKELSFPNRPIIPKKPGGFA
jgi:Second Messenger Oligonucleotide or Dinucleotide Synthetase domain